MIEFKEWVESHKNDCFRYWIKKELFTPYEIDLKDEYQCLTENDECMYGYIVEFVLLPDNDVMIALSEDVNGAYRTYYKLSRLDLALCNKDNE